jgi:hypothetical protein
MLTDVPASVTFPYRDATAALFGPGYEASTRGTFGASNLVAMTDAKVSRRFVRVSYPAGSASATVARQYGKPVGGAQFYVRRLGGPYDRNSMRLSYWVRFADDFPWVRGGKLPGLYGGMVNNGKRIPDGTNGFSTRYMWRTGGRGEVYAYLPTSKIHGTSLGQGDWVFPRGTWIHLVQDLFLNHPGKADGEIKVSVQGKVVSVTSHLRFRDTPSLQIDGVFFSSFFGGDDPSWAPGRPTHADFSHVVTGPASP